MAITITDTIQDRIDSQRREIISRLAAQASHFVTEPDTIHPGAWIVRNPKIPGRCEIVTPDGQCTCRRFRLSDRCKHSAIVAVRFGSD